jgi:Cu/Ag efflux protein CusF
MKTLKTLINLRPVAHMPWAPLMLAVTPVLHGCAAATPATSQRAPAPAPWLTVRSGDGPSPLQHGEIKNLDARHDDGVSSQPAMLSKVKTGDKVKFKLGKAGDWWTGGEVKNLRGLV